MKNNIKKKLNYHYKRFDKSLISPDPLEFLHRYENPMDIEASGIVSSIFAYGRVELILDVLDKIHLVMGKSPFEFIENFHLNKNNEELRKIKYRFYNSDDIIELFNALSIIYNEYGSLKRLFLLYHFEDEKNLKDSISFFSKNLLRIASKYGEPTNGLKFMFPDPYKGSTCKRMNLFLRWMIRKDELDFGIWAPEINPSQLIIPVDTHIARICRELKLTSKKNPSWLMAEEITNNLKLYCKDDPVKYDFAICHIGMRKLSF